MTHTLLISSIVMFFLGSALMAASDMYNRKKSEPTEPRYRAVEEELSDVKLLLSDEMYQKVYNNSLSNTGKYKNYVSVPQKSMPLAKAIGIIIGIISQFLFFGSLFLMD